MPAASAALLAGLLAVRFTGLAFEVVRRVHLALFVRRDRAGTTIGRDPL